MRLRLLLSNIALQLAAEGKLDAADLLKKQATLKKGVKSESEMCVFKNSSVHATHVRHTSNILFDLPLLLFATSTTLKGLKEQIQKNAEALEKEGLCSKANNYQELLNAVAQVSGVSHYFRGSCFASLASILSDLFLLFGRGCAQDIRNQRIYRRQRKQELVKLKSATDELENKKKFYSSQVESFDVYIDAYVCRLRCVEGFAHSGS